MAVTGPKDADTNTTVAIALLMSYAITLPFLAAGAEEESNDAAAPEAVGHEVVP